MSRKTLSEFATQTGVILDKNQSRILGAILTQVSKENHIPAEKVNRKYKDDSGRHQVTSVNTYPEQMIGNFILGCRALGVFIPPSIVRKS